jgi:FlaA1/EpsC-like NDP-sugar epimerase
VVPTFAAQIAKGGPVLVTDPRMTRYFMSVHEAVMLALQAAALSCGREIFTLNVGEPVNILELAERMVRLSGRVVGDEIAIDIIGARPGEKLEEQLQDSEEEAHVTSHPAITRLSPLEVDGERLRRGIDDLARLSALGMDASVRRVLDQLAVASRAPVDNVNVLAIPDEEALALPSTFETSA